MGDLKKIIVVSDGTGKTAKRLMDAVLAQYTDQEVRFSLVGIYQEVRTPKKIDKILIKIDADCLVIFSIISDDLRKYFHKSLHDKDILHLDVLDPMLKTMKKFLGVDPNYKPGLLQIIDDKYYSKIDAIGFTVEHDDGRGYQHDQAQVVLLGLSRTCKTPISMYLACDYGMRVANIPIIADDRMKKQLLNKIKKVKRENIIGLMMSAEVLSLVRMERSHVLADDSFGQSSIENYSDITAIRDEIRFCRRLFNELDIEVIDVTRRAIEEVSGEILDLLGIDERESHL
jgi:[pyruvate, water dikinase]-phosphate phosphotransferase / [pyruvate, water dikinase] kinase